MSWLKAHPDEQLSFVQVRQAIKMDPSNFGKLRRHPDFVRGIAEAGIEEERRARYAKGFRYADEELPTGEGAYEDYFSVIDDEGSEA